MWTKGIIRFSATLLALAWASSGWAVDFVVSVTNDAGPGSLRQALLNANVLPGPDRIVFAIEGEGNGVKTIRPLTLLPEITDSVIIDGYTQPGARPNAQHDGFNGELRVQLDGGDRVRLGFDVQADETTIRGLAINRFRMAIVLNASSNRVTGNFIGPDPSGLLSLGNVEGIVVGSNICCITIGGLDPSERNVIAGNTGHGIAVNEPTLPPVTNILVLGNFLGTDRTGLHRMLHVPGGNMISVRSAVNFTLGGSELGARNIIAVVGAGLFLYPDLENVKVVGNYFGLGVDGVTDVNSGDFLIGISIHTSALIEANRIAHNDIGISLGDRRALIRRNEIFANRQEAIRMSDTVLTNDVGDIDTGPNDLQNFPVLDAWQEGAEWVLTGTLSSRTNNSYTIELFANRQWDQGWSGQGELFIASLETTTDSNGIGQFLLRLLPLGEPWRWISATATDAEGNTSIFAPSVRIRSITQPLVHVPPQSLTVRPGTNIAFAVNASGAEPLFYQWRWNGTNLPNANGPTLALTNVQLTHRGAYSVEVSNALGRTESEPAIVTVLSAPIFLQPPLSQTVVPGQWVTLSVEMSDFSSTPLGFRWRSNATILANSGPGDKFTAFYTFQAGSNTANYSVIATNQLSPLGLLSAIATVTVASDRDHDGLPDALETKLHLDADDPTDASGDLDGDGASNLQEYLSGTDAEDPLSFLKLEPPLRDGGQTLLTFAAKSNKTYRLQFQNGLIAEPWVTLTNLTARKTNQIQTLWDPEWRANRFYRVTTP